MTPEQCEELKQAAEEATGGEWVHRYDPGNPVGVQHGVKLKGEHGMWIADCLDNADKRSGAIGTAGCRNADYIARANPSAILSLIAEVEALTVPQWQPIETAPQDGYMLVHEDGAIRAKLRFNGEWQHGAYPAIIGQWGDAIVGENAKRMLPAGCRLEMRDGCCENPTHWMPLPNSPEKNK